MVELLVFQDCDGHWRASLNGARLDEPRASTAGQLLVMLASVVERRVAEDRLALELGAAIRTKLAARRSKGTWTHMDPGALHGLAHEEMAELLGALNESDRAAAMLEAADVAIYAAMAADVLPRRAR